MKEDIQILNLIKAHFEDKAAVKFTSDIDKQKDNCSFNIKFNGKWLKIRVEQF